MGQIATRTNRWPHPKYGKTKDCSCGCATFGHSCYGGMGKRMSPADLLTNDEVLQDVQQDNNPGIIFTGPRGDVGIESDRKISLQELYNLSPFFRQWCGRK
ncbi:hypothetical protein FQR65_LT14097 [Abscondita terminalis]|nr:hypothetical protein FQR65_LT14097 [Abscondita terminalis]